MVDTDGRALKLHAHSADIQDRDGAGPLLRASRATWPFVALGYADGGYAGPRAADASPIRIEVVRKSNNQVGFAVIARRWAEQPKVPRAGARGMAAEGVERFFAWINRKGGWHKTSRRPSSPWKASSMPLPASSCSADWIVEKPTRNGL